MNSLLDNNKETVLPTSQSDQVLANKFQTSFSEKIEKIRASIDKPAHEEASSAIPPNIIIPLSKLEPATADEIREIIKSFPIKCSPDDPLPASVVKETLLITYWVEIMNLSEMSSMESLKKAVIFPLIKGLGSLVDKEIFKNYRPVSNLLFLSKLVERIVDSRLEKHFTRNNLHAPHQFGYKKDHSTEALLLKIVDRLQIVGDKGYASVVLLLDLSAAFDTVDHMKMLEILHNQFGVTGSALNWFESFLIGRTFSIQVGDSYSEEALLPYGVAQGSVLGPRLFNCYTKSINKHVEQTKFEIEGFADDHQLMKHFMPIFQNQVLGADIQDCMKAIHDWMNIHFLRLNQDKTKVIVITPPSLRKEILVSGMFLNNECIRFVDTAKNLGFFTGL